MSEPACPELGALPPLRHLTYRSRLVFPAKRELDPHAFYQTRKGLVVTESFKELVLSRAESADVAAATGRVYDLEDPALIGGVVADLRSHGSFTCQGPTRLCAYLAHLIDLQREGQEGTLSTRYMGNRLLLEDCLVGVGYHANAWGIYAQTWQGVLELPCVTDIRVLAFD